MVAFLAGVGWPSGLQAAPAPVRVLIFSGQNNHNWKENTARLREILTSSDRFTVEVTDHPEQCTAASFARCEVILSDWNAWGDAKVKEWPAETREAFLRFVRQGGGYVVVHAGSSSFYDWPEYQQLSGASWKLGQTSHGAPHEFVVQPVGDHPITRGLEPFSTKDELWIRPGIQPGAKVLATAEGQPIALVTTFGKGRDFTLLLGHAAAFMKTPGFQTLLLRGTEWAATGRVTIQGSNKRGAVESNPH